MAVEIRQTVVTPDAKGDLVQLHISDAPLDAEDAAIRLVLTARVGAYEAPALAHLQREAMKVAQAALTGLLQKLASEIQSDRDLNPKPRQAR